MTRNYYEFLVHDHLTIVNPRFVKKPLQIAKTVQKNILEIAGLRQAEAWRRPNKNAC